MVEKSSKVNGPEIFKVVTVATSSPKAAAKLVVEESVISFSNCPNALVPTLIRNASNSIKRFMFIKFRN